jgi:hypothetical protein
MQPVKDKIHSCYDNSREQYEKYIELVCFPIRVKAYSLQGHVWVRVMGRVNSHLDMRSVNSHIEGKLFDATR